MKLLLSCYLSALTANVQPLKDTNMNKLIGFGLYSLTSY